MPNYFIYPIYTIALALIAITIIPKKEIHRLAIYGIFSGAVMDIFAILIVRFIGNGGYINYGPFGFLGIPFFPPIAWTIFFIMYLYILPKHKIFPYIFTVVAAGYSVFFSNILINLGIFKWNYSSIILPFILYASWFTTVTWVYFRLTENMIEEKNVKYRVLKINTVKNENAPNVVADNLKRRPKLWTGFKRLFCRKRVN
ncbi:hypothetical protein [Desulfolucanica intricata]|uniref:hypothetical protein n=1 Tax=Desulfolucanica intricata TaxID=1285191 RepID=UPI000A459660|nr:hypothetical protein [Desulfolucanica intricata]